MQTSETRVTPTQLSGQRWSVRRGLLGAVALAAAWGWSGGAAGALRILHPATLAGSAEFIVDVQPSAAGGKTGDVMVNDVFGRAVGLDVPLTSSARIDYAQSLVPYRGYLSGIA